LVDLFSVVRGPDAPCPGLLPFQAARLTVACYGSSLVV
jgi:hypothetical protein